MTHETEKVAVLANLLRKYGIWKGLPERRAKLASVLYGKLTSTVPVPSENDLDLLYSDLLDQRVDNPPAILGKLLETGRWGDYLADIKEENAKRSQLRAKSFNDGGQPSHVPSLEETQAILARQREQDRLVEEERLKKG